MPVTPDQVVAWKKEYGHVYTANYKGVDYVFREITIGDYQRALQAEMEGSAAEAEDALVESALLSHTDINKIPAGFVSMLADEVIEVSGFGNPRIARGILQDERNKAQSMLSQIKAFVLATMPSYKEEELDNLTFQGLCKKLALAEEIIKVNQMTFGGQDAITGLSFEIEDPEAAAAQAAAEEKAKQERQRRAWELLEKSGRAVPDDDKGPIVAPEIKPDDAIAAKLREALGG